MKQPAPTANVDSPGPRLLVVMGVSGCGKTTVGNWLSQQLQFPFFDGDDFHPPKNRQKMESGTPLNDDDRAPWLQAIVDFSAKECVAGRSLIFACSALKKKYREHLRQLDYPVVFVHLLAPMEVVQERQANRPGHYMPSSLLASQYAALESPAGESLVVEVSVAQSESEVASELIEKINSLSITETDH